MKLYDLGASVLLGITVIYFVGWLSDKAKAPPPPQCLIVSQHDGQAVQRWRDCTPAELAATR